MGGITLVLEIWMVVEAVLLFPKVKGMLEGEAPLPAHVNKSQAEQLCQRIRMQYGRCLLKVFCRVRSKPSSKATLGFQSSRAIAFEMLAPECLISPGLGGTLCV